MKLIIEFDAIEEKGYIDYIKKLDKEEKQELKDIAIVAIMEHINEQFEREKREKEQWEKSIKQDTCKHDYKEIRRDSSDPEGQPYDDESGEYAAGLNVFLIVVQNVISTNTNYKVLNGRIEEKKRFY
jgi:hypothetical protein